MDRAFGCGPKGCRFNSRRAHTGRDGRVVEGAVLEKLYGGNPIVGSNPTLSALVTHIEATWGPYPKSFSMFAKLLFCSHSSMDRVMVSETIGAGSIPAGSTK